MIEIIPAIDLIDGKAVRLCRGDYGNMKVYGDNPVEIARVFEDAGVKRIHVVDLDGAKISRPVNLGVLESIASAVDIQIEWGGGISDDTALESVFSAGATHAIVGSVAVRNMEMFETWLAEFGDRMILGADVNGDKVAVSGWTETSSMTIDRLLDRFIPCGLKNVITTDISRDGMLEGPATGLYRRLISAFPGICFTASGGVGSISDVIELERCNVKKVIIGKAIYENRITIDQIRQWLQNA